LKKAPKNFEPPPLMHQKIFNFRAAAADGPKKFLIFEPPPPPIEASAYTSSHKYVQAYIESTDDLKFFRIKEAADGM
jgi:hypothetical protein